MKFSSGNRQTNALCHTPQMLVASMRLGLTWPDDDWIVACELEMISVARGCRAIKGIEWDERARFAA